MRTSALPLQALAGILYVLAQVLLGSQLILFDRAFAFLYLGFLLLLPFEIGPIWLMLIGFLTGLFIDLFYDTVGVHAIACLVTMFLRPNMVNILMPQGGIESGARPSLRTMGSSWFVPYALVLIFIHHLVLFFVEAFTFRAFFFTLGNAFFSTLITFASIVLLQLAFYPKQRI